MRTITTHGAGIRGFRVPEEQVSTLDKVSKCHTLRSATAATQRTVPRRSLSGRRTFSSLSVYRQLISPGLSLPFFASFFLLPMFSAQASIDKTEHSNGGFSGWFNWRND